MQARRSIGFIAAVRQRREVDGVDVVDTSAAAIRTKRRSVEKPLHILAHGIALLAIGDCGLWIAD